MIVQPNHSVAPNGYSPATLLSGDSDFLGLWQTVEINTPGLYTFSVFAKEHLGSRDLVLALGDQESIFPGATGATSIALPGGWHECAITANLPAGHASLRIALGAGTGSILIFGASLFEGAAGGAYIPSGTFRDYEVMAPGIVAFREAPQNGTKLLWEGSYEYEPNFVNATIMSQYANSPRLLRIIYDLWGAIDPSKFNNDYFNLIMSIPTANTQGLDIWGRIVGIGRTVYFPDPEGEYFGFEDGFYPFNERPFSAAGNANDAWELADDVYRELILIKAMSNIVYATAPNINILMRAVFKKPCYFLLTGHMQGRYVFEFELNQFERHIVYNTDILPRPCGVDVSIIIDLDESSTFGFDGSGLQPFGQGVFYNGAT